MLLYSNIQLVCKSTNEKTFEKKMKKKKIYANSKNKDEMLNAKRWET